MHSLVLVILAASVLVLYAWLAEVQKKNNKE